MIKLQSKLNVKAALTAILKTRKSRNRCEGIAQYIYLINKFCEKGTCIPQDKDFKKIYNEFFDLTRFRSDEVFQKGYYEYMEDNKTNEGLSFKEILKHLKELPPHHKVEKSFGSKLLSMINPEYCPPWDGNVKSSLERLGILESLRIKVPSSSCICAWSDFYEEICVWYKNFVAPSGEGTEWIGLFDTWFEKDWHGWYTKFLNENKEAETWIKWLHDNKKKISRDEITKVKKIDLIFWQAGANKVDGIIPSIWKIKAE